MRAPGFVARVPAPTRCPHAVSLQCQCAMPTTCCNRIAEVHASAPGFVALVPGPTRCPHAAPLHSHRATPSARNALQPWRRSVCVCTWIRHTLASSYSMPACRAIVRSLRNARGAQRIATVAQACLRLHIDCSHACQRLLDARMPRHCTFAAQFPRCTTHCNCRAGVDASGPGFVALLPAPDRCPHAAPLHLHCAMPSVYNAVQPIASSYSMPHPPPCRAIARSLRACLRAQRIATVTQACMRLRLDSSRSDQLLLDARMPRHCTFVAKLPRCTTHNRSAGVYASAWMRCTPCRLLLDSPSAGVYASAPGFVARLACSYSIPACRAIAHTLRNALGAQRTATLAQECLRLHLPSSHSLSAPTRCPLAVPLHCHCAIPAVHNAQP